MNVAIRDAAYSRSQMSVLAKRIMDDQAYWRTRDVFINGAAPQPDGSGVLVYAADHIDQARRQLSAHYPSMHLTIQKAQFSFPFYTSTPVPSFKPTGPTTRKTLR